MAAHGSELLRISLGIVFLWFGLLKVLDRSPVADLVALTLSWFPADVIVPVVGAAEVVVGLGLLFRVALRLTLLVFWGEMLGTFLVLFLRPELAFQQGNPLLLTDTGEFVIKNLVLIAAGLVVASTIKR